MSFKVAIGSDPPAGPLYKMIPLATSVNTSAEKRAASKDKLLKQKSENKSLLKRTCRSFDPLDQLEVRVAGVGEGHQ